MLRSQAAALHETGLILLDKGKLCPKPSEMASFTELGLKCLSEAREIVAQLKNNSVLIFLECCAHVKVAADGRYGDYLDFCARNSLDILSEEDFHRMLAEILD